MHHMEEILITISNKRGSNSCNTIRQVEAEPLSRRNIMRSTSLLLCLSLDTYICQLVFWYKRYSNRNRKVQLSDAVSSDTKTCSEMFSRLTPIFYLSVFSFV